MRQKFNILVIFLLGIALGLLISSKIQLPPEAQAFSSGDNCKQWAVNVMDLPASKSREGETYYIVPHGWEPIDIGLAGTTMKKCIKS